MKSIRTLGIILACMLCGHIDPATAQTPRPGAGASSSPARAFDPLAPVFDVNQWAGVQSAFAKFSKEHPDTRVELLKSIAPTGTDGTFSRQLYSVNLIVVENGKLLYSFAPLAVPQFDSHRMAPIFYMDDVGVSAGCPLEVRDVTGDQVPEIIFHAGMMGASDHETDIHVLQYIDGPTVRFRDIRGDNFVESWWTGVRFLDLGARAFVVVAEPVYPPVPAGDFVSHGQPKFHKYLVYGWSRTAERFELVQTIPETKQLHESADAGFQADWNEIVSAVRKHVGVAGDAVSAPANQHVEPTPQHISRAASGSRASRWVDETGRASCTPPAGERPVCR